MKHILSSILLMASMITFYSCDKELGLDTQYDNSESSIIPDSSDNYNPNKVGEWDQFSLSKIYIVNQGDADMKGYWPDGKLSVVKDETSGKYICFWGEKYSYRTEADTPYPEDHISQVIVANRVFGQGINDIDGFNDGGSWFIGVHKLTDGRLAGFFHAESHWPGDGIAYKSVGVAYSSDNGKTWTSGEKILNVDYPKPTTPTWSGLGDGCVVYNEKLGKFICYYSAHIQDEDFKICMAASDAIDGASGSWRKWDGNDFTISGFDANTGLGGVDHKIEGLSSISGANPSVMWNSYLKRWVIVYASWGRAIYMSTSEDGLNWEIPIKITEKDEIATYPNLISSKGDLEGNYVIRLYYGSNQNDLGVRDFAYRIITYN